MMDDFRRILYDKLAVSHKNLVPPACSMYMVDPLLRVCVQMPFPSSQTTATSINGALGSSRSALDDPVVNILN